MVLKTMIRSGVLIFAISMFLLIPGILNEAYASGESPPLTQSIRQQVEQESLNEALNSFYAGDYRKAKTTFEILSETAQSPEIARRALFGLASAKLILALTPDEYADAVSSWEKWSKKVDSITECEDPRMITPFLVHLKLASMISERQGTKARKGAPKDVDHKAVHQAKEKEMQSLRVKLDLREREIRRLRHQLESLEEIHRKYQEKKQEANP